MAHKHDADAPTHVEHTGHGGHHVLSRKDLLRTFGILVFLTIVTVGLAYLERAHIVPLGGMSVPVALAIAGAKAYFVAAYFMGLKYEGGTNLLAFVGSIVFVLIFLGITMLDTEFRGLFADSRVAMPIDVIESGMAADTLRSLEIEPMLQARPLVLPVDTAIFGGN
ncbi:hypothetical protein BH23BAC4_BH23BAC4_01360 [soil metagenome]